METMIPVKKLQSIDVNRLMSEWNDIKDKVSWKDGQTAVHYREQCRDRHLDPCGWPDPEEFKRRGGEFQKDFVLVNDEYKGSIIEEVLNEYQVYRARVMTRQPNSCYRWHKDNTWRIHIPLVSDHGNFLAFEEYGLFRVEPGHVYTVNTTLMHTFFNGSKSDRTHIVGPTDLLL